MLRKLKWQMANGKWQMANGKWQMADGKFQENVSRPGIIDARARYRAAARRLRNTALQDVLPSI